MSEINTIDLTVDSDDMEESLNKRANNNASEDDEPPAKKGST